MSACVVTVKLGRLRSKLPNTTVVSGLRFHEHLYQVNCTVLELRVRGDFCCVCEFATFYYVSFVSFECFK